MTPEHARWLLEHPITDTGDPEIIKAYCQRRTERDGALLTLVLAIDR